MSDMRLMENIDKNRILREIEMPPLVTVGVDVSTTTNPAITTKKSIKLTHDEFMELTSDAGVWMNDEHRTAWLNAPDDLALAVDPGYSFYDVEYYGGIEKLYPSFFDGYRTPMIPKKGDITMEVCGAEKLSDITKRHEIMRKYVPEYTAGGHHEGPIINAPEYEFNIPKRIKYTSIQNPVYRDEMFIPFYKDPVTVLITNIPYNYYAYQPIHDHIYVWDSDKECHEFMGLTAEKFEEIMTDICENGIQSPILFTAFGDILLTNSTIDYIRLFVAKILHIPSIPAIIMAVGLDETLSVTFDMMQHYPQLEEKVHLSTENMRNIFAPHIIFAKDDEFHDDSITVNGVAYKRSLYIEKSSCNHYKVMCLNTSTDTSSITSSEEAVNEAVNRLRMKAKQDLSASVEEARKKLEGR